MNEVEALIISSSIDFSTDLVCMELEKQKVCYVRLNRDHFNQYRVLYNMQKKQLTIEMSDSVFVISNKFLKSVYFRAPVFIRAGKNMPVEEQLMKNQWNAFIRNLVIFEDAKWINNPSHVYRAENKLLQLEVAKSLGMNVPKTYVGNCLPDNINKNNLYVVKSLDTALFYDGDDELFTYSNVFSGNELMNSSFSDAPVFIQEYLENKADIRVTVVGDEMFSASITAFDKGIAGDWRKKKKEELQYKAIEIPSDMKSKIQLFMKQMNLEFAGIDLAAVGEKIYFIECNPTGEWEWLEKSVGFEISKEIAKCCAQ